MPQPIVLILDDDPTVRGSLLQLCESAGLLAQAFKTSEDLLESVEPDRNCCIVLDLHLSEETGLNVQKRLAALGCGAPIIFLTGHGTIAISVTAMRAGALEFLTKPVQGTVLLEAIHEALQKDANGLAARMERGRLERRLDMLTPREREILPLVISGLMI